MVTTRRSNIATLQSKPLRPLREEERAALERLVERASERVDRVRRARALLAVAAGASLAAASRMAGLGSPRAVASLVGRFNAA
jgi:hypothetical protein